MIRQKSFENDRPTLYLVPTPIGNLSEMSPRAIEVLKTADVIACEDTRTSGQMLKQFDIHSKLIAYQNFNETTSAKGILALLEQGQNVALISDAGYPLVSDPGQYLVNETAARGFNVVPISGPNAMLDGLVASGLIVQPFIFIGFLPPSHGERVRKLAEYRNYPMTLVFYEAPHRIEKMLKDCLEVLGDRKGCLARELTKIHEEFLRGTMSELLAAVPGLKGEMVVVVDGCHEDYHKDIDHDEVLKMVNDAITAGMSARDAIREIAGRTGWPKNEIYELVHRKDDTGRAS